MFIKLVPALITFKHHILEVCMCILYLSILIVCMFIVCLSSDSDCRDIAFYKIKINTVFLLPGLLSRLDSNRLDSNIGWTVIGVSMALAQLTDKIDP